MFLLALARPAAQGFGSGLFLASKYTGGAAGRCVARPCGAICPFEAEGLDRQGHRMSEGPLHQSASRRFVRSFWRFAAGSPPTADPECARHGMWRMRNGFRIRDRADSIEKSGGGATHRGPAVL